MDHRMGYEEWHRNFLEFWIRIERLSNAERERHANTFQGEKYLELHSLFAFTLHQIRELSTFDTIERCLEETIMSHGDDTIIILLGNELAYFNRFVAPEPPENREETNEQASAATTIKDSIEKLVRLPDWLKDRMGIVNELLSLLRAGA